MKLALILQCSVYASLFPVAVGNVRGAENWLSPLPQRQLDLTCESTTPEGEAPSIHEIVCSGGAIPACGSPGQTVAFQGGRGNSDVSSPDCNKINVCHGTGSGGWNAFTVDRSSIETGHANSAHSKRDDTPPKVDYFPGVSFKNPRGAAYGRGKLGLLEGNGGFCGFICTEPDPIGCVCPLQVQCEDTNGDLTDDWVNLVDGSDENDCQYEDCPEQCPESAHEFSDDFGEHDACVLHPDSTHPLCNYLCCDKMKECRYYDEVLTEGTCDLVSKTLDASDSDNIICEYDCNTVCQQPCSTSVQIGENCWFTDDTAGICEYDCCDEEQECVGGTGTAPLIVPLNGDGVCIYDESECGTTTTTTTTSPTEPSVTDDPHFLTWNNTYYDFMGACDLKLITAPFFAPDLALDIDIRTTIRYQYSYIESAVVKIGENTLEVTSFGGYMLDGVSSANLPSTLAGFAVKHSQPSKHVHLFEIILSDEEKILVKTFKDMVSVKLSGAKSERFHGSQGMLGSYDNHGLMLARDGATILEDGDAFAAEWQIRDSEPMVFQTVRAPQFPEACQLPTMAQEESRRRLAESSITMEAAEEACASWPKETISGCIHDVLATGDLELAAAGAF